MEMENCFRLFWHKREKRFYYKNFSKSNKTAFCDTPTASGTARRTVGWY